MNSGSLEGKVMRRHSIKEESVKAESESPSKPHAKEGFFIDG